jgi:NAD(P) transhydrogenase subunit alpha
MPVPIDGWLPRKDRTTTALNAIFPKERRAGENRVAVTPDTARSLAELGIHVVIEANAGAGSFISDSEYEKAGAEITSDVVRSLACADIVLKVGPPLQDGEASINEIDRLKPGALLVGVLSPYQHRDEMLALAEREVTALSLDLLPRITRAQRMDALSSQANIAGYKAVILAASRLGKYFPLMMTAAGTVVPARVLVLGAGVAGLQALATAKRLGARIWASDLRPAVADEVASLGGNFVLLPGMENGSGSGEYAKESSLETLQRQQETLKEHVAASDVVICTARVPGMPSPTLVTTSMIHDMRPGSVIVDLAVEQKGNCEVSVPDCEILEHGVLVLAPSNLPATVPIDASRFYARNLLEFVRVIVKDGKIELNLEDEIIAATLVTHRGQAVHRSVSNQQQEVTG